MWSCMPGGLRELVISFKFRKNRLNGFRDVGGRKLSFPILKASGLYNSLYYCTSRDIASCVADESEAHSGRDYEADCSRSLLAMSNSSVLKYA